jgi:adenylate kinase
MSFPKNSNEITEDILGGASKFFKKERSGSTSKIQKRIFYHPLNSLLGHSFVECTLNINPNEFLIVGTVDESDDSPSPEEVTKVFDKGMSQRDLLCIMADCDIIIFESLKTDISLLETVTNHFESTIYLNPKTLILVSNPLIWYETRIVKNSFLDSSEALPQTTTAKGETKVQRKVKHQTSEPSKITDTDFFERRTLPCYELHRLLENRVYSLNDSNTSITGCIILPGLLFGKGEDAFYPYFEYLFESPSRPMVCFGKGDNYLPFIYSIDLADRICRLISQKLPLKNFYVCANNEKITQKQFLTEFGKIIGMDKIVENASFDAMLDPNYETMTLNMQLQTSTSFYQAELNGNKTQSLENINSFTKIEAKNLMNFGTSFEDILSEFIKYRGIQILRMVLICPDVLLKSSSFLNSFSQHFNVDVIAIDAIIETILNSKDDRKTSQFANLKTEIEVAIEEEREAEFQRQTEAFNEAKKAKKKNIVAPVKSEIKVEVYNALSEDTYFKILMSQLQDSKYRVKGFILVNAVTDLNKVPKFLKTVQEKCKFSDFNVMHFNFDLPKMSAKVAALEQQLKANAKSETLQKDVEEAKRLLEENLAYHVETIPSVSPHKFTQVAFIDPEINTESIITNFQNQETLIDGNFHPEPKIETVSDKLNPDNVAAPHENENANPNNEPTILIPSAVNQNRRASKMPGDLNGVKLKDENQEAYNEEEAILNLKSASIKQYLADNILPEITEAIVEICKEKPENPVKFLVEFLKSKASQN